MGKQRPHIPYRNSFLTSVLRDSLGGNCRTTMVATINPAQPHLDEGISTCRFAQRVACVANAVALNEEVDPTLIIRRLKAEVRTLKARARRPPSLPPYQRPPPPNRYTHLLRAIGDREHTTALSAPRCAL